MIPPEHPFDRAFDKLSSLTNYERKKPNRRHRFDLTGTEFLCHATGNPERALGRVVQVGGSKGKGTVTSLLAGMGHAAGLHTCSYLSPHVVDVRERVRIGLEMVSKDAFAGPLARVCEHVEQDAHTWFEAFTVAALGCFRDAKPDLTVLEVGLGGRLDSTTFVPKDACCITSIELEHTHILGDTIPAVAGEKAAILRPGVPCVTAATGAALEVIEAEARRVDSPLFVFGRDLHVDAVARSADGLTVDVRFRGDSAVRFELPLHSRIHARSFALAYALFTMVFPEAVPRLLEAQPRDWVPSAMPPGRFQLLSKKPPIVVDGAHTDGSLAALAEDLAEAFPKHRFKLVFSIATGKRWQRGLGRLLPLVDMAWVAPLEGKAGVSPEEMQRFLESAGIVCRIAGSVGEAVLEARRQDGGIGIVVTGSLYAAGDAIRALSKAQATDIDNDGRSIEPVE